MAKKRRSKSRNKTTINRTRRQARKKQPQIKLRSVEYKPLKIDFTEVPQETSHQQQQAAKPKPKTKSKIKPLTLTGLNNNNQTRHEQICKRRQQRKEIIHALNKSGKGGQKKPDNKTRNTKC